jgi:hypothetical protein
MLPARHRWYWTDEDRRLARHASTAHGADHRDRGWFIPIQQGVATGADGRSTGWNCLGEAWSQWSDQQ